MHDSRQIAGPSDSVLKQWVIAAQSGDEQALGNIYDLLYDRIYAYAYRRTGDQAVSQDIVANSFYRMLQHLYRFKWQRASMFYAWVFKIVGNEVNNYYRNTSRYTPAEDWLDIVASNNDDSPTYDETLDRQNEYTLLRAALNHLDPKQRQVVELYYFADLSHAEIGKVIGKREGTVRVQLHRAIGRLKQLLPQEQGGKL